MKDNQEPLLVFEMEVPEKISLNRIYSGVHWNTRREWADDYHEHIWALQIKQKITKYPVKIRYIFTFANAPLDTLNCALMAKMIEDGLKREGVIVEDNWKNVNEASIRTQKHKDKKLKDMVMVEIYESN